MTAIKTKQSLFKETFPNLSYPAQIPCKHFFSGYHTGAAVEAGNHTPTDLEGDLTYTITALQAYRYAHNYSTPKRAYQLVDGNLTGVTGTVYVPETTDDIIIVSSGSSGTTAGIYLTDDATKQKGAVLINSGVNYFLGQTLAADWFDSAATTTKWYVMVWNSTTKILKRYKFLSGVTDPTLAETAEISIPNPDAWTGIDTFYDHLESGGGSGLALYAFADGSLPNNYEDGLGFIISNWQASSRISPRGWGRNT